MNNLPLVSICIPTYNGEEYLREALDSAIQQTYQNIEIIISDDHSKDQTLEIVKQYKNKTTIPFFIYNHEPHGIGANWNHCVNKANGGYIKFLFQDDTLENTCIEELIKPFFENNKVGLSFCKRKFILHKPGASTSEWLSEYKDIHSSWTSIHYIQNGKDLLKDKTFLSQPRNKVGEPTAVLLKKEVFNKVGFFRTDLKQSLDYEYWYRVFAKYHIGFINKELISFRIHKMQASSVNSKNTIADYDLYPKLIYKNLFWHIHPKLKKHLFFKYNALGKKIKACK